MLIAYKEGTTICAHCGKELLDGGVRTNLIPRSVYLDLRHCESQAILCEACAEEKGTGIKSLSWYGYLGQAKRKSLIWSYEVIKSQLEKKRTHLKNTGKQDTDKYKYLGDLVTELWDALEGEKKPIKKQKSRKTG